MKTILASKLKKGDLIYCDDDTYREVLDDHTIDGLGGVYIGTKTYMAPTVASMCDLEIGTISYIPTDLTVLLLYRKEEV